MFCPNCRTEYREGFSRCADCDIELVGILPAEQPPEYVDLVTVFEGDSNSAAVIGATFSNASIESWVKNEGIQGVFPSLGPAEVQVGKHDEQHAREILGMVD